jgi:hypothetical protein
MATKSASDDNGTWEWWRLPVFCALAEALTRTEGYFKRKGASSSALYFRERIRSLLRGGPRSM